MTLHEPLGHHGPLLIPSLHRHNLNWYKTPNTFTCAGCKEDGKGSKYKCEVCPSNCPFNLHEKCTLPPSTIVCMETEFRFHHQVPGNMKCDGNKCDACNKVVRGFCYSYSRTRDHVVHPCCANLPPVLHSKTLEFCLRKSLSQPCIECKKKGPGWSYLSKCQKYNLHVACAEAWEKKVRKTQAMIPRKVGPPKNQHDVRNGGGGGGGGWGKILKDIGFLDIAVRLVAALFGDPTAIL